ncbi:hypothetical protein [Microcoleus sp. PH2017_15_JOR_U_A]|nr:hypothetical protein [Microcoleus sp. PH2017_15_JOR_U_A]
MTVDEEKLKQENLSKAIDLQTNEPFSRGCEVRSPSWVLAS